MSKYFTMKAAEYSQLIRVRKKDYYELKALQDATGCSMADLIERAIPFLKSTTLIKPEMLEQSEKDNV